jgi:hypothetical protein
MKELIKVRTRSLAGGLDEAEARRVGVLLKFFRKGGGNVEIPADLSRVVLP